MLILLAHCTAKSRLVAAVRSRAELDGLYRHGPRQSGTPSGGRKTRAVTQASTATGPYWNSKGDVAPHAPCPAASPGVSKVAVSSVVGPKSTIVPLSL